MLERRWSVALTVVTVLLLALWLIGDGTPPSTRVEMPAEAVRAHLDEQARYAVAGTEVPVVRPPPGDVWLLARRWDFEPGLELEPGKAYRLHIAAEDVVHSAVVGDTEVLLVPGQVVEVPLVAPPSGRVRLQCGEYCGLGHTRMIGSIEVAAPPLHPSASP
jgi:cytochrome c oxidase subunit 2